MQHDIVDNCRVGRGKRGSILNAALKVFVREGYAASVDQVAAEAGVSKQTVYAHFGNKEGLFRACVEATKFDIDEAVDSGPDLRGTLGFCARAILSCFCSGESIAFQRLLIAEAGRIPEAARLYAEAGPSRTRTRLMALMARWIEAGEIKGETPDRLADDFMSLLVGIRWHRLLLDLEPAPDEAKVGEIADHAVEIFLQAYRTSDAA